MIQEAALVTLSCVLFVQMGLSGAIQDLLRIRLTVASCPKCLTMWSCLAVLLWHGHGLLESVAASFVSAYAALWLALAYDSLAAFYNYVYETITPKPDTSPEAGADATSKAGASDAVSQMLK